MMYSITLHTQSLDSRLRLVPMCNCIRSCVKCFIKTFLYLALLENVGAEWGFFKTASVNNEIASSNLSKV